MKEEIKFIGCDEQGEGQEYALRFEEATPRFVAAMRCFLRPTAAIRSEGMDILTRLDACAECEQAPLAALLADAANEIRMLRRDAERYRWLRDRMAVEDVPEEHPAWSTPSEDESAAFDSAVDARMKGANA